jgi:hypothetical protein
MSDMHAEGDLGLLAVAAEMSLAGKNTEEKALLEGIEPRHAGMIG